MSCVSEESVQRFVDGALGPERFLEVEAHVEGCSACRELLAAATRASFDAEGTGAPAGESPDDSPRESKREESSAAEKCSSVGRYQLGPPIGAGGMGVVYAATDPQLQRRVALKLLHNARRAPGDDDREALIREARAMAQLSHPNVLPIFEVGESAERIFLVMELAERGSLRDWLAKTPRPLHELLELFIGAGRGLAAAHAAGLVHRDFKPANVLLGANDRPLVTDFGLARPLRSPLAPDAANASLQQHGARADQSSAAGSPGYMAPEQLRGEPVGPSADLFSFSVALYEALYQTRPFAGSSSAELLESIAKDSPREPPPDSMVPRALFRVLAKGLKADPAARFSSMGELLTALESARHAKRRRNLLLAAGAGALACALMTLLFVSQNRTIARLAGEKARLDGSIAQVLQQLDNEEDPHQLALLDEKLVSLESAERAQSLEAASARSPESLRTAPGADDLDRQLRVLLSKFGADTYVVPPLFKARLRAHIAALLASQSLAQQWSRKRQYWPQLTAPLRALGLPEEMAYLAWAESRFDPVAKSPTGATGMWQFTDFTARRFGLRVDQAASPPVDERTDVDKSSQAAAHYLAELLAEFGSDSFLLGIASYNMGENQMRRALAALSLEPGGFKRDKRDFWHLYLRKLMPGETREYVFAFLAAAIVGTNAQKYGL